jgi:hypothetical protein
MSQFDLGTIDAQTTSGSNLASRLNSWKNAVETQHAGTSRPTYIKAGQNWINTSLPTAWRMFMFDGTRDVLLGTINPTTGALSPPPAEFTAAPIAVAASAYSISANDVGRTFQVDLARPATAITLPLSTDVYPGWSIIIRAGGVPANGASQVFQTAYVASQGTDDLIYNGFSQLIGGARRFALLGYNEMFRFTWAPITGWIVELVCDGAGARNAIISRTFTGSGGNPNSGSTAWIVVAMTSTPTGTGLLFNWANALITVPVSGWYWARGWVVQGFGTIAGNGYIGLGPAAANAVSYGEMMQSFREANESAAYNSIHTTAYLHQGEQIGLFHTESATGVYWFPDSSYVEVDFYRR